jgi:hypothetical protein
LVITQLKKIEVEKGLEDQLDHRIHVNSPNQEVNRSSIAPPIRVFSVFPGEQPKMLQTAVKYDGLV